MPALNEGFRYVAGGYDDPDTTAGCGRPSTRSTPSAGPLGTGCSTCHPGGGVRPVIDGLPAAGLTPPDGSFS